MPKAWWIEAGMDHSPSPSGGPTGSPTGSPSGSPSWGGEWWERCLCCGRNNLAAKSAVVYLASEDWPVAYCNKCWAHHPANADKTRHRVGDAVLIGLMGFSLGLMVGSLLVLAAIWWMG